MSTDTPPINEPGSNDEHAYCASAVATDWDIEQWRSYLLSFPGSVEDMPFGPEVLVYKVAGKLFALLMWQGEPMRLNLKCEPNLAQQLRAQYSHVESGYHMNKKHWNTVHIVPDLALESIKQWVSHSYDLIYNALPKAIRVQLTARN